jgi:hypothetical protein
MQRIDYWPWPAKEFFYHSFAAFRLCGKNIKLSVAVPYIYV